MLAYHMMPFGLCNGPATFQKCMMAIFDVLVDNIMEIFMDNFSVFGYSFVIFIHNLARILKRYEKINLILNWEKYHFLVQESLVLGHKT